MDRSIHVQATSVLRPHRVERVTRGLLYHCRPSELHTPTGGGRGGTGEWGERVWRWETNM